LRRHIRQRRHRPPSRDRQSDSLPLKHQLRGFPELSPPDITDPVCELNVGTRLTGVGGVQDARGLTGGDNTREPSTICCCALRRNAETWGAFTMRLDIIGA
jgi:hypothetical protein